MRIRDFEFLRGNRFDCKGRTLKEQQGEQGLKVGCEGVNRGEDYGFLKSHRKEGIR